MVALSSAPLELLVYILLAGFSLGIIAYNLVLYHCTRETIYLHFSATLFSYTLGVGQWNIYVRQLLWPFNVWKGDTVTFMVDTLNIILFISFIQHFLTLFIDFTKLYPRLAQLLDIYILIGLFLIVSYLVIPHPALFVIKTLFTIVVCLTAIIKFPQYYSTIKHLSVFIITTVLFCLLNVLFNLNVLMLGSGYHINFSNNLTLLCGTLFFASFSLLITHRLKQEQAQQEQAQQDAIIHLEKYQQLYEQALEGLFTVRLDGCLLAFNSALTTLLTANLTSLTIQYTSLYDYFAGQSTTWARIVEVLQKQGSIEAVELEGLQMSWYSFSARLLNTEDGDIIEGSLIDITERKQQTLELALLAHRDPLTNLFNRVEFEHRLQDAIYQSHHYAVLFIDLDQFKVINDSSGHPAGDECLKQVAELLQQHLLEGEIVVRFGGDEFAMMIIHNSLSETQERAEMIRNDLAMHHFTWYTQVFRMTASIGIVVLGQDIATAIQAINLADTACYAAKEAGRNCVMLGGVQSHSALQQSNHIDMLAVLNNALENNQLVLFKQAIMPIVADDASPPWYELLLRLRLEDQLLEAKVFLPAAQRYGLMPQIDRWVFKNACEWLRTVKHQDVDLLNINLNAQTLSHPDFFTFVKNTLRDFAVSPSKLCFEITECHTLNEINQVVDYIQKLRKLGIRFALDDFGNSFGSFDYLKRLSVDFIKIDGQFIREITQDDADMILVRAISNIMHSLGKQVIAESVEDYETATLLHSFGVDFGQGYYLGKPEALSKTTRW